MDVSIDICCLCLKEPLIKEPLIDLNSSRPTYFEKITSTLTKLAQVLNDLNDCDFHICKICASNIELIYSFNSKWLDNVRLYSLRGLLRTKRGEEQCYDLETSRKFSEHSNIKVAKVIKKEVEDSSNSMNIPMEIEQVIIKEECIKGVNEVSSPDKKSTLQQPKQDFAQVTLISRSNNQEVNSHPDVNASSTTKIELRRKELQNIQDKETTLHQSKENSSKVVLNCKSWYIQEGTSCFEGNVPTTKKVFISLLKRKGQQNNTDKDDSRFNFQKDNICLEGGLSSTTKKTYISLLKKEQQNNPVKEIISHHPKEDCFTVNTDGNPNVQENINHLEENISITTKNTYVLLLKTEGQQNHQDKKTSDQSIVDSTRVVVDCKTNTQKGNNRPEEDASFATKTATTLMLKLKKEGQQNNSNRTLFNVDDHNYVIQTKKENLQRIFICYYCGKSFRKKGSLREHERIHTDGRPYTCDVCGKAFRRSQHLRGHMLVHTDVKPYECTICKRLFRQKCLLNTHLLTHREGFKKPSERPKCFICEMCGKEFYQKIHLINHRLVHSDYRAYSCEICGKQFKHINNLNIHKRVHTEERPYTCDICDKTFKCKSSLNSHTLVHSGERPYACNFCNKTFPRRSTLSHHKKTHTGIKPHVCSICSKAFIKKYELDRHIVIHTGEKPYACDICDKTFALNSSLARHIRVHTGERPYECEICSKSYTKSSHLKRHKLKIHNFQ